MGLSQVNFHLGILVSKAWVPTRYHTVFPFWNISLKYFPFGRYIAQWNIPIQSLGYRLSCYILRPGHLDVGNFCCSVLCSGHYPHGSYRLSLTSNLPHNQETGKTARIQCTKNSALCSRFLADVKLFSKCEPNSNLDLPHGYSSPGVLQPLHIWLFGKASEA